MKSHEITEFQYKADSISRERVSACSSSSLDPPKAWVVHLQLAYKAPSDLSCKLVSNNTWQGVSLHPLWPNKTVKSAEEMNQGLISHLRDSRLQDSRCIIKQNQHNSAHFWVPIRAGGLPHGKHQHSPLLPLSKGSSSLWKTSQPRDSHWPTEFLSGLQFCHIHDTYMNVNGHSWSGLLRHLAFQCMQIKAVSLQDNNTWSLIQTRVPLISVRTSPWVKTAATIISILLLGKQLKVLLAQGPLADVILALAVCLLVYTMLHFEWNRASVASFAPQRPLSHRHVEKLEWEAALLYRLLTRDKSPRLRSFSVFSFRYLDKHNFRNLVDKYSIAILG